MPVFTAVLLVSVVVMLAVAARLVSARRRLAAEIEATRRELSAELGERDRLARLLEASQVEQREVEQVKHREVEQEAKELEDKARRAEDALRRELEQARAALEEAKANEGRAEAGVRLTEDALEKRTAELALLLEQAQGAAAQAAERERAILGELEAVRGARAEVEEARLQAEEEARLARTAKEAFAGEARLLREELQRTTAKLEAALKRPGSPAQEPAKEALPAKGKQAPPVRSMAFWCQACGRGGTKAERCCENAR
jgi:hypothetical protein